MSVFDWKPEYSVGDDQLDREHKELFRRAGALHQAMLEGRGNAIMDGLLQALADYTNTHFRGEEIWMERSGYPLVTQHKMEHEHFRQKIRDLSGRQGSVPTVDLMQYLSSWLRRHIAENDQKIAEFRRKAAGQRQPALAK